MLRIHYRLRQHDFTIDLIPRDGLPRQSLNTQSPWRFDPDNSCPRVESKRSVFAVYIFLSLARLRLVAYRAASFSYAHTFRARARKEASSWIIQAGRITNQARLETNQSAPPPWGIPLRRRASVYRLSRSLSLCIRHEAARARARVCMRIYSWVMAVAGELSVWRV